MRLTVGPLPPAVYWRRRAIVLGVLLFAVVLFVVRCAGSGASGSDNTGNSASTARSGGATPEASSTLLSPVIDPPASSQPTGTPDTQPNPLATGPCEDAELAVSVTPDGNLAEYTAGSYVKIFLKIKNTSTRSCARDVGAAQQELRIVQGTEKFWSSDDCPAGVPAGPDVRMLRPGEQLDQFHATWNGLSSNNCQQKAPLAPGSYEIIGRVGTKWSEPVAVTIKSGK